LLIFIHIPYDPGLNPRLYANTETLRIMTALLPALPHFKLQNNGTAIALCYTLPRKGLVQRIVTGGVVKG